MAMLTSLAQMAGPMHPGLLGSWIGGLLTAWAIAFPFVKWREHAKVESTKVGFEGDKLALAARKEFDEARSAFASEMGAMLAECRQECTRIRAENESLIERSRG